MQEEQGMVVIVPSREQRLRLTVQCTEWTLLLWFHEPCLNRATLSRLRSQNHSPMPPPAE